MGLARRFERGGDNGLTQSGMTLGTFDYISPEQARDPRDVDVRSDLYSLGCTLFHMLTGRPPFPGGTVLQKLIQHQEESPADVRTLNPQVPVELSGIIAKLMAKDRDRRYQTPEHLVRDLSGVAGAIGLATASSSFPAWQAEGASAPVGTPPGLAGARRRTRRRGGGPCLVGPRAGEARLAVTASSRFEWPVGIARDRTSPARLSHRPAPPGRRTAIPRAETASSRTGLFSQYPGKLE